MNKRLFWLLSFIVVLAVMVAACTGGTTTEQPQEAPAEQAPAEEAAPAEEPAEEAAPAEEEAAPAEEPAEEVDTSGVTELNILWAQWDPADYLQEIANMYEEEFGVTVNVIQEPWGSFFTLFSTEMAAQGGSYDMVVGDSQWLGWATTSGHYVDLTGFLTGEGIAETVTPATLQYYGEYPAGSGTYWAYPTEGDANGWAYRKDLFENPDEMAAFEAEYGYPLAPPENMEQLMDVAQFFTRPDEGLYGVAIYTQADYDALTMGFQNALFSFGSDWKDAGNNPMGVVNSQAAIDAAQFYRDLYDCCQAPGLSNAFFVETNDAYIGGQVAMSMNYFAFFPALVNPEVNPYAEDTGFFVNPAGPNGQQHAALGGQGLSIVSYIAPERQEAAQHFIKWFAQESVQAEWARLGGYTCNINVLESQEFLDAAPFNPAFAETMTFVKDFWNIPEYEQLLRVSQTELGRFIIEGQGTAEDTMNSIAEQHEQILREAGYITEGGEAAMEEEPAEAPMADIGAPPEGITELNILWAQWDPADYLQEIANMYEEEFGVTVNVIQEPWGSFFTLFSTEMAAQGGSYDMVVGDSQWLGWATTSGHYVDLTGFLTGEGIAETVTPATLQYYGEYPAGSGTYWAYPTEGDANGWAYRKDLFENPDEMAAFEAEYGYPLAPPENMEQLMDVAQFFTRPDEGLYGVAIYTQADYDALTMGFQNALFSFGSDWKDAGNNPMGVVNSQAAIDAAQFYRDLYDCCQAPGLSNAFFVETNDAYIGGQVAMSMNYFAFFPALVNPEVNPYAEDTGFFVNPAGPNGQQHAALGGQGLSIVSYIAPERQEAAQHFIKWFAQESVQAEWARLGGYTCNINVLESQEFLDAAPFNPAFAETMTFVKDFWNIPEYEQLLRVSQTELGRFIIEGQGTAEDTMNSIAEQHEQILREAGYIE